MKKKVMICSMILLAPLFMAGCQEMEADDTIQSGVSGHAWPHRYYIDPENGMYYNTGHSPEQAWESVDRINERIWQPGDTILIKRGTVYDGTLVLRGSGTADAPIVITAYGDASLPLPVIAGGGVPETVMIRNVEYWELHNLHVTNKGDEPLAKAAGIRIEAENMEDGEMNHIVIRDCMVSDVYGTKTHHNGGGGAAIHYYNVVNGSIPTSFNGLVIEGCHIKDCQRDGIIGFLATGDRQYRKASKGVIFSHNLIEGVPGDQILVNGCDDAVVEYNVVRNCAEGDFADESIENRMEAAAALWCMHSDRTVFRYNIVQDHKATWDGQAFDCDQNCQNTLFEYNISYNNVGGWIMLCPSDAENSNGYADHTGTVIRYNISINDGTRDYLKGNGQAHSATVDVVGRVVGCHFYNNTVIKTRSAETYADNTAIAFDWYTNVPNSLRFTNNIFYNTTGTENRFHKITAGSFEDNCGLVLENNCIYGYASGTVPGDGTHNSGAVYEDPEFTALVSDFLENGDFIDKEKILDGLGLATGSPCIGSGKRIEDTLFPVENDFWGFPCGEEWNIGAYNH